MLGNVKGLPLHSEKQKPLKKGDVRFLRTVSQLRGGDP